MLYGKIAEIIEEYIEHASPQLVACFERVVRAYEIELVSPQNLPAAIETAAMTIFVKHSTTPLLEGATLRAILINTFNDILGFPATPAGVLQIAFPGRVPLLGPPLPLLRPLPPLPAQPVALRQPPNAPPGHPRAQVTQNQYALARRLGNLPAPPALSIETAVVDRIQRLFNLKFFAAWDLRRLCLDFTQQAEITVNIKPPMLFTSQSFLNNPSYDTPWIHPELWSRGSGASGNPDYRILTERSMSLDPLNPNEAVNERLPLQPGERAISGALNVCRHPNGGAPHYGKSFFILHRHVIERASFMPGDSWAIVQGMQPVGPSAMLTHRVRLKDIERIFQYISDNFFRCIVDAARGGQIGDRLGEGDYMEALIMGSILLNRDVAGICIDCADLAAQCKTKAAYQTGTAIALFSLCRVNILRLTHQYNILLRVTNLENDLDDGPWTWSSRDYEDIYERYERHISK